MPVILAIPEKWNKYLPLSQRMLAVRHLTECREERLCFFEYHVILVNSMGLVDSC